MNVQELRTELRSLEAKLTSIISKQLLDFRSKTGFTPEATSINLVSITKMGQRSPDYYVGGVDCRIEI